MRIWEGEGRWILDSRFSVVYLDVVEDQVPSHVLDVVLSPENGPTERAGLITEASIIQLHIFISTATNAV